MGGEGSFPKLFATLTGHGPFPWQERLFERFISDREDNIPHVANLPTGLGKTSVIAVWLLASMKRREKRRDKMPRRLVYVVNRRTVVDQSTAEVNNYRQRVLALDKDHPLRVMVKQLGISTLRGQYADNQEWSADPSRPAVICGTVDMIGSRLLFEGYRIGFKSRPLHAGFLGQDALLVHDEAHLEPAFQKLIETIECEQRCRERTGDLPWRKLHVMALSATTRSDSGPTKKDERSESQRPFGLTDEENNPPDQIPEPSKDEPPIHHVWRRLKAKKALELYTCGDENKNLVDEVIRLALEHKDAGQTVVIYLRRVEHALAVYGRIEKELRGRVKPLTGTMRGLERDELVTTPVFQRFLHGAEPGETVYLVCTSAGEVGVNLSADHMVCDLSTFDSMAQRFGRVNRFGDRPDTRVDVVYPESFDEKHALTPARNATLKLLQDLNGDASPKALGDLLRPLTNEQRDAAFAPEPKILPATDILFDAWAMTTIRGKMPGRPPVGPYLHGVADDLPQTTIAWRAELDLFDMKSLDAKAALQRIFRKHRIRPHETLTTTSYRVADFLQKLKKRTDLHNTRVALQFSHEFQLTTVQAVIDDSRMLNAEPTLILPASFGGRDDSGMLSVDSVRNETVTQNQSANLDFNEGVETESSENASNATLDVADHDGYEPYENVSSRIRVLIVRSDDRWAVRAMPGGKPLPDDWEFESRYERSTPLVNAIRKQSCLNVRLVQALEIGADGEDIRSLVCLSPGAPAKPREEQSLTGHVSLVEKAAKRIAEELILSEPYRSALFIAAKWHDEGKRAPIWQRYIAGPDSSGKPLGKSAKWRNPKLLAGYRHEFGTLLRITDDVLPKDPDARELALHMIATHHGYGRPHFQHIVDHDFTTQQSDETHYEVIRRYARLQRRYGRWGLAYLESLLRAADGAASRAVGLEPEGDDDDLEEDES